MKECNLILPNFKTKMKTKYLKILILIAAFFIAISSSFAQEELTVAEKKALKKEIKAYKKNPELYKDVKVKNEKKIAVMGTGVIKKSVINRMEQSRFLKKYYCRK